MISTTKVDRILSVTQFFKHKPCLTAVLFMFITYTGLLGSEAPEHDDAGYLSAFTLAMATERPTMPPPIYLTSECDNNVLTVAPPPQNITYYWQTSPNNTSTANSSLARKIYSPGTYYLRSYDQVNKLWSEDAQRANVSVIKSTPDAEGLGASRVWPGEVDLDAISYSDGTTLDWINTNTMEVMGESGVLNAGEEASITAEMEESAVVTLKAYNNYCSSESEVYVEVTPIMLELGAITGQEPVGYTEESSVSFGGTIHVACNEGRFSLMILCNGPWEIERPNWIYCSRTGGTGNQLVHFEPYENYSTSSERSVAITVIAGGVEKTFTVVQRKKSLVFDIDKASGTMPHDYIMNNTWAVGGETEVMSVKGSIPIDLACNVGWTAKTDKEWIKLSQTSGTGNAMVTVDVDACVNLGYPRRAGNIEFTAGGITKSFEISQEEGSLTYALYDNNKANNLERYHGDFTLLNASNTVRLYLDSEFDDIIRIQCDHTWLVPKATTTGPGVSNIDIAYTKNPNSTPRYSNIRLYFGTQLVRTLRIVQSERAHRMADHVVPSQDHNYVYTVSPRMPMSDSELEQIVSDANVARTYDISQTSHSIAYFDGLGRHIQTIGAQASPTGKDIVQHVEYDEYGRQAFSYLPYTIQNRTANVPIPGAFRAEAHGELMDFYDPVTKANAEYATTEYPYSESVFEPSPLGRVLEQGAPGQDWQPTDLSGNSDGHTVKSKTYASTEAISSWNVATDHVPGGGSFHGLTVAMGEYELSFSSFGYLQDSLRVNEIEDENGKMIWEYTTKSGQVVMKKAYTEEVVADNRVCLTRYIYDKFGLLRCIMPPKATSPLDTGLCYYYVYDNRHRMILKKLPGAAHVAMVYDLRDRLVATQDGNQRAKTPATWLFTRYDQLNRPIMTGEVTGFKNGVNITTQVAMNTWVNNYYSSPTPTSPYDVFDSGEEHFYTQRSFPADYGSGTYYPYNNTYTVHSVTYYDDYRFKASANGYGSSYDFYPTPDISGLAPAYNVFGAGFENDANQTGAVTGGKVLIMGTQEFMESVTYYDDRGRPVQVIAENQTGYMDRASTRFNFVGEVLATVTEHNYHFINDKKVVGERFAYDHVGQVTEHYHEIADNPSGEILMAASEYNDLGGLSTKHLHTPTDGNLAAAKQKLDYRHNERGWLTSINDPDNLGGDLFAMALGYNDKAGSSSLGGGEYNGNISSVVWTDAHNNTKKGYSYTYDGLNRLFDASYYEGSNLAYKDDNYVFVQYDLNGNITYLDRFKNMQEGYLDNLTYHYADTKSNQLSYVTDGGLDNEGFEEGSNTGQDYFYDANGNMVKDLNKGLTNITYNHLNLPVSIAKDGGQIGYVYSAGGVKLEHTNLNGDIIEYVGIFVYKNGNLDYMLTPEGRITINNGNYGYEYHLKDHLGNTRVVMDQSGAALEVADYFPFGMRMASNLNLPDNKYLYNGKELQEETDWYDYGARMYDAALGRWMCVDPLAEKYYSWSPYNYCYNSPIKFLDPNGMEIHYYENKGASNRLMEQIERRGKREWGTTSGDGDPPSKVKIEHPEVAKDVTNIVIPEIKEVSPPEVPDCSTLNIVSGSFKLKIPIKTGDLSVKSDGSISYNGFSFSKDGVSSNGIQVINVNTSSSGFDWGFVSNKTTTQTTTRPTHVSFLNYTEEEGYNMIEYTYNQVYIKSIQSVNFFMISGKECSVYTSGGELIDFAQRTGYKLPILLPKAIKTVVEAEAEILIFKTNY